jgi:hypothetical protein
MAGQDAVEVDGQRVAYEWLEVDVRSEEQRRADTAAGHLAGDPVVVLPGHGQTAASPAKLTAVAAALSVGGVAWCVHIHTPAGGDPVKARALGPIVRERIAALFAVAPHGETRVGSAGAEIASLEPRVRETAWGDPLAMTVPVGPAVRATLIGWSHGGGEALRSAEYDPALFPGVAGLCPAGLIERRTPELVAGFLCEVLHIVWTALFRRDGPALRDGLRVGFDILRGMWQELIRSRSLRRALDDMRWASRKVPGPGFGYSGAVALVFARGDMVIRWQAVFPACTGPQEIPAHLDDYRRSDFPKTAQFRVTVLEGDHLSPESAAAEYARTAFRLLGLEDPA